MHLLVVVDSAAGKIGVGDDEYLTVENPDPAALDPNPFHHTRLVSEYDVVPQSEGMVEENDEVAEKVSQNSLCSNRYGYASNPKPGESSGDIEAEIAQEDQETDYPQDQLNEREQRLEIVCMSLVGILLLKILGEGQLKRLVQRPDDDDGHDDGKDDLDYLFQLRTEFSSLDGDGEYRKEDQREADSFDETQGGEPCTLYGGCHLGLLCFQPFDAFSQKRICKHKDNERHEENEGDLPVGLYQGFLDIHALMIL